MTEEPKFGRYSVADIVMQCLVSVVSMELVFVTVFVWGAVTA